MRLVILTTTWYLGVILLPDLLSSIHSFVPPRPLVFHSHHHHHYHHHQQQQHMNPMAVAFSSPFAAATITATTTATLSSNTALSMGIVEDFVSSSDQRTRQVDNDKYLQELQKRVDKINEWEEIIEELDDDQLQAKTREFQQRLSQGGENINGPLLEEAFAVVREAAW
jgi:hypothetical protein